MSRIPTDFEIMEELYERYYDSFRKYAKEEPDRIARSRVPINVQEIASACGVEEDMIFGRIFYHFNKKYSYKDEKGRVTTFFVTDKFEGLSVNFPLVASVLADLKHEKKQNDTLFIISSCALACSIFALIVAILF
ncbi:hypothetical protein ACKGJO_06170 [Gracilimonas sp. Q87]|uniref:hypothetical protein n=1 Tax=Gracilimonas sp. Q87 TaxID=3384766 RepID=UPI0039845885